MDKIYDEEFNTFLIEDNKTMGRGHSRFLFRWISDIRRRALNFSMLPIVNVSIVKCAESERKQKKNK